MPRQAHSHHVYAAENRHADCFNSLAEQDATSMMDDAKRAASTQSELNKAAFDTDDLLTKQQ